MSDTRELAVTEDGDLWLFQEGGLDCPPVGAAFYHPTRSLTLELEGGRFQVLAADVGADMADWIADARTLTIAEISGALPTGGWLVPLSHEGRAANDQR